MLPQEYNKSYILAACYGQGPCRKRQGNLISKSFLISGAEQKPKTVLKHPVSLFAGTDGAVFLFLSVSDL